MSQQKLIERLNKPIDFDQVKKNFIQMWGTIFDLGMSEIDYIKLAEIGDLQADNELYVSLVLVGVARVISKNIGHCPFGVEEYWIAASNFIDDIPIGKEERTLYSVRITHDDKTA